MPFFGPGGEVLLDVTLHREGLTRRWTISSGTNPGDWDCRIVTPNAVVVSACANDQVHTTLCSWQSQIAAAKADGWT